MENYGSGFLVRMKVAQRTMVAVVMMTVTLSAYDVMSLHPHPHPTPPSNHRVALIMHTHTHSMSSRRQSYSMDFYQDFSERLPCY